MALAPLSNHSSVIFPTTFPRCGKPSGIREGSRAVREPVENRPRSGDNVGKCDREIADPLWTTLGKALTTQPVAGRLMTCIGSPQ